MPLYLDLGVVRIQEYINRTTGADEGQLRKRRGASRMIANATAAERFSGVGCRPNTETYAAEGVAHLIADTDTGRNPRELANELVMRTQSTLPNAYIEASWCVAANYARARRHMEEVRSTGLLTSADETVGVVRSVPAVREDPYAALCDGCGLAAAESGTTCQDCRLRDDAGRPGRAGAATRARTPEQRTIADVASLAGNGSEVRAVRDLNQLARLPAGSGAKRNQLATIYADGNGIGALFGAVESSEQAKRLSSVIDNAIRTAGAQALYAALHRCSPMMAEDSSTPLVLPGVVTVLAADDVLITVPADVAWLVVRQLLATFGQVISADLEDEADLPLPTLSAGMYFHHVKTPLELSIAAAHDAMRTAKSRAPLKAAIGWVDENHPAPSASWATAQWFDTVEGRLNEVVDMPANQRAKWERVIQQADTRGISEDDVGVYLVKEAARLGVSAFASSEFDLDTITRMIAIARWWPSPSISPRSEAR